MKRQSNLPAEDREGQISLKNCGDDVSTAQVLDYQLKRVEGKPRLNMARVGVSESWLTTFGVLKAAGALRAELVIM